MSLPFFLVKQSLKFLSSKKRDAFIEACQSPRETQEKLKQKILANSLYPFPEAPTDYLYYKDKGQLTKEPVSFYETTSGSTGSKKQVPYTKSLLKSFENMFLLWANDLVFHSGLSLEKGKFFMSISPQIGEKNLDDRKYLSGPLNLLLSPFLASQPNAHARSGDEFLMRLSKDLLNCHDLEVISVWSPTYLLSLLDFIEKHSRELNLSHTDWNKLWPKLKLISSWTHAQAERPANALKNKFPGVMIQPKGLLMTEAPVTLPWSEANGCVPLITETYLEFLQKGKIFQIDELKIHETYTVLTSQFNGYLRYNTQDEVKVTGHYFKTPVLEFIGRSGGISDLAGEKLSETVLRDIFKNTKGNFLIVPDQREQLPSYVVFTDSEMNCEKQLREIYHYNLARELNQLKEVKVIKTSNLNRMYLEFFQTQGMNLGDIKERILLNDLKLAEKFLAWTDKEFQSSR